MTYSSLTDPANTPVFVITDDNGTRPIPGHSPNPGGGYTEDEAYAILTGRPLTAAAPLIEEPDGDDDSDADITAEQTGAMIALVPSELEAQRLALDGGEEPVDLHLTLLYLGEATDWDLLARTTIVSSLTDALRLAPQVTGFGFGVGEWNFDGTNPCIILNVGDEEGSTCLDEFQKLIIDTLTDAGQPTELPEQHSPWVPHIALAYSNDAALAVRAQQKTGPVVFDRVRVAFAEEYTDLPLYASTMTMQASTVTLAVDSPAASGVGGVGNTNLPATAGDYGVTGTPWYGVLAVEGSPTGDGRQFAEGSLTWPEPPLPLSWAPENLGEHMGSVMSGSITNIWRDPDNPSTIMGAGVFDDNGANGAEALRQVKGGFLKGVSVDVDSVSDADVELVFPPSDEEDPFGELFATPELTIFNRGRIRGATQVALPAFVEASIQLGLPPNGIPVTSPGVSGMSGASTVLDSEFPHNCGSNADLTVCAQVIGQMMSSTTDGHTLAQRKVIHTHMATHLATYGLIAPEFTLAALPDDVQALFASGGVMLDELPLPPDWAFENPNFAEPTPLEVLQADGHMIVRGHAALSGTCHLSFPGACVTLPPEPEQTYFRLGDVLTASGQHVAVGSITLGTGHASSTITDPRRAQEHYDNTGTVVARVASGLDKFGLWVAGYVPPGTPLGRVTELAAAKLSGDWRRVGGQLRLVAMLAVNTPGFPVPRLKAHVNNGRQFSLVAAGMLPDAASLQHGRDRDAIQVLKGKLAQQLGRDVRSRAAALRAEIHGG